MWKLMGGRGYFTKAISQKEASKDGVHFLAKGYNKQAEIIWESFNQLFP